MALNESQLAFLTDQQRERYNSLEKLFEHPGWQVVSEFLESSVAEQSNRVINAQNWDTHRLATGARLAFAQILNLPQITEQEFSTLAAQAATAAEVDEEEDALDYE